MKAIKSQTFRSEYGRGSITVSGPVPTIAIRRHLGRVHVGTPVDAVLDETRAEIEKMQRGPEGDLWTDKLVEETLAFTRWQHEENQAEYAYVMGGH